MNSSKLFSQEVIIIDGPRNPLYSLEEKIMVGDKDALKEIGKILASGEKIYESLGHHLLQPKEREIALRIIQENTLFLPSEIKLDTNLTAEKYLLFFEKNYHKIYFSKAYDAFLMTPLEERSLNYKIRTLPDSKKITVEKNKERLLKIFETQNPALDKLIKEKSPLSLKLITEEYFRIRIRYNRYHFQEEDDYSDLLQLLTQVEIGIVKKADSISYETKLDPMDEAQLELLTYWTNHYKDYIYDNSAEYFVNKKDSFTNLSELEQLFDLLNSEDDSTAFDAFIKISNSNSKEVKRIAAIKEGSMNNLKYNYALGSFPYRFLSALSELTQYCRENNIDYNISPSLIENIEILKGEMDYSVRLSLEDYLIDNLKFDESIVLEYWSAIYGQYTNLNYSAGRILDKFYSKHWNEIINDEMLLKFYLRKASWLREFGINGITSGYDLKFENSSPETLDKLKNISPSDEGMKKLMKKIFILNSDSTRKDLQEIKDNFFYEATKDEKSHELREGIDKYIDSRGNITISKKYSEDEQDFIIEDAEQQMMEIINSNLKPEEREREFFKFVSKLSYEQIPLIIELLEKINFTSEKNFKNKYSFLLSNFGLPFEDEELQDKNTISELIENHKRLTEYDLYEYYLHKKRSDYKNSDGTLNFDNIYWILKYDIVQAFAGGGGAGRYTEIYSIIKLLELHFNTRLGYTRKLCNCGRWSFRRPDDRAATWMVYLKEKGLLTFIDNEPRSFYDD